MTNPIISAGSALKQFPGVVINWWKDQFPLVLLLIPLFALVIVYYVSAENLAGWGDKHLAKSQLEIAHPVVLALTLVLAIIGRFFKDDLAFVFMIILTSSLLAREILGQGNSWIVHTTLICLIIFSNSYVIQLASLLQNRGSCSSLTLTFVCYFIAQVLDRDFIVKPVQFIFSNPDFDIKWSSNMEEALETLGGVFVLISVLYIYRAVFCNTVKRQ